MTIYGRIVDGVLLEAGDLPQSARRLSTNQIVYDLAGTGAIWRRDCGWFDLATVDPAELTQDPTKRAALMAAIAAALAGSSNRVGIVDKAHALTDLARDRNWDWLDKYCHGTVAQIPFVQAQSPNAGIAWGSLSTNDKAEALRLGVSYALAELLRAMQAIVMLADERAQGIARDADLAVPTDR